MKRAVKLDRSTVQEVLTESLFLSTPQEEFESLGYYTKPAHLS